ncbi:MAG: VOC family protein [Pseudomonadota bacterium]
MNTSSFLRWLPGCVLAALAWSVPAHANEPGDIPWFDLVTEDEAAAIAFYRELFGWTIEKISPRSNLITHKGLPIGGISGIDGTSADISESQWVPALEVEDVATALAAAEKHGATVEKPVTRDAGWLTYAVISDPESATLSLVDTEREIGGNEGPGFWVWAEFWTDDVDKAAKFHGEVAGLEKTVYTEGDRRYPLFEHDGEPKAGIVLIPFEDVEAGWAPYIGVADLRATLAKAESLGGRVYLTPEVAAAGDERVALLGDPAGAAFFVFELDEVTP